MLLETKRLYLRRFIESDIEATYLYSQENSRKRGIPNEVYADIQEARNNLKFICSKYKKGEYPYVFAIALKDTDEYIGHVSLSKIPHGIEIGYAVCEKHQRQGYAAEAVEAYIAWGKKHLHLKKIYALTYPDNIASEKVLQKTGFVFIKDDVDGEYISGRHFIVYAI